VFTVEGIVEVNIPDGCTASTKYYSVTGVDEDDDELTAERAYSWPATSGPLWASLDVKRLETLTAGGTNHILDAPMELEELQLYLEEDQIHHGASISRLALWATVAAVALAGFLATFWLWRNKVQLQRKMRALLIHGAEKMLDTIAQGGQAGRRQDADALRALLPEPTAPPAAT
jgi:hypothetical protein